jgi:hypothetical protein
MDILWEQRLRAVGGALEKQARKRVCKDSVTTREPQGLYDLG